MTKLLKVCPKVLASVTMAALVTACGDDPTSVEFEVIEETEFAASLGIDLTQMTRLATGVYIQDMPEGTGAVAELGTTVTVIYRGFLSDGDAFDSGQFSFPMGQNQVVPGFEDGIVGMRVGGTRLIIIPPERGYGATGSGPIPPGAIMVFEVELIDVQ